MSVSVCMRACVGGAQVAKNMRIEAECIALEKSLPAETPA